MFRLLLLGGGVLGGVGGCGVEGRDHFFVDYYTFIQTLLILEAALLTFSEQLLQHLDEFELIMHVGFYKLLMVHA